MARVPALGHCSPKLVMCPTRPETAMVALTENSDMGNQRKIAETSSWFLGHFGKEGHGHSRGTTLDVAYWKEDFRQKSEDTNTSAGRSAEECQASRGHPRSELRWTKDGSDVGHNNRREDPSVTLLGRLGDRSNAEGRPGPLRMHGRHMAE